jgi:hypothetical protein
MGTIGYIRFKRKLNSREINITKNFPRRKQRTPGIHKTAN